MALTWSIDGDRLTADSEVFGYDGMPMRYQITRGDECVATIDGSVLRKGTLAECKDECDNTESTVQNARKLSLAMRERSRSRK